MLSEDEEEAGGGMCQKDVCEGGWAGANCFVGRKSLRVDLIEVIGGKTNLGTTGQTVLAHRPSLTRCIVFCSYDKHSKSIFCSFSFGAGVRGVIPAKR